MFYSHYKNAAMKKTYINKQKINIESKIFARPMQTIEKGI